MGVYDERIFEGTYLIEVFKDDWIIDDGWLYDYKHRSEEITQEFGFELTEEEREDIVLEKYLSNNPSYRESWYYVDITELSFKQVN